MRRFKCVWAALLAFAVALGLCGCSAFGAPATTEELLVRYVANENAGNFAAAVNVDISVNAMGVRAVVPVSADLRVDDNVAHGTIEADLSSLDTRDYVVEFYAELLDDALNCYIGTPRHIGSPLQDGVDWKLWTIDTTSKIDIFTITELLSASELTIIAKDSDPLVDYELAVPVAKVLKTAFDVTAGTAELGGMDEQGLIDAVGNDKVRVGFTEDCLVRSLSSGVLLTFKSAETNNVEVRTDVEVSATFDDYGKVRPSEVAIPNDARDAAARTDAPFDMLEVIGEDSPLAGAIAR